MKNYLAILLLLFVFNGVGQSPERVYGIAKERRALDWYKLQAELWEKEIKSNKNNAEAWYNYYNAIRALRNLSPWDSKDRKTYYELSEKIVKEAYATIPNTFEANHLMWRQSGNDQSKINYLFKAYEIDSLDERTYEDLMTHYALVRNVPEFERFCHKFFKVNEFPGAIYNWAYNMLAEVDENAIILTAGDNDTYSSWVIQVAKNFRKDVRIVNSSLILVDDYRTKLFKEMGLPEFKPQFKDIKTDADFKAFKLQIFDHLFKNEIGVPVYVSGTAISQFTADYADRLFVVGLTYKYAEESFDNISIIRRNYEKRYLLDYLTMYFSFNKADNIINHFSATYLPAFAKLYKHYQDGEEYEKLKRLEGYLLDISKKSGKETEIKEILGEASLKPNVFDMLLLNTKSIEKNMVKLKEHIYLNKFEVTNTEYQKFLLNIREGNPEMYAQCLYDSSQWVKKVPHSYTEPMKNLYHSHPAYANYPIVNISHQSALAYCDWLTKQYNGQVKRKYNTVKFRLPTEAEWMMAARGGNTMADTYFKGDQLYHATNKCYQANLKIDDGNYSADGGFFTVKVDAYSANGFGFYNMIGNVAEMLSAPGKSKGGSWFTSLEESIIPKVSNYAGGQPDLGFRIVMEVIVE